MLPPAGGDLQANTTPCVRLLRRILRPFLEVLIGHLPVVLLGRSFRVPQEGCCNVHRAFFNKLCGSGGTQHLGRITVYDRHYLACEDSRGRISF